MHYAMYFVMVGGGVGTGVGEYLIINARLAGVYICMYQF